MTPPAIAPVLGPEPELGIEKGVGAEEVKGRVDEVILFTEGRAKTMDVSGTLGRWVTKVCTPSPLTESLSYTITSYIYSPEEVEG